MKNLLKLTTPFLLIGLTACGGGGFKPLSEKIITSPHPAAKNMGIELNCKTGAVRLNRSISELPEINSGIWYEYDDFVELTSKNKYYLEISRSANGNSVHKEIIELVGQFCTKEFEEL